MDCLPPLQVQLQIPEANGAEQHLPRQFLQANRAIDDDHHGDKLRSQTTEEAMASLEPGQCSVCGYKAAGHSFLVRHMRSHTGERPFACSLCPRTFSVRHNLLRHERIHTGERPYKCSVCKENFLRKAHLQNHMRVHQSRAQRSTEQQRNAILPMLESLMWDDPSQN